MPGDGSEAGARCEEDGRRRGGGDVDAEERERGGVEVVRDRGRGGRIEIHQPKNRGDDDGSGGAIGTRAGGGGKASAPVTASVSAAVPAPQQ